MDSSGSRLVYLWCANNGGTWGSGIAADSMQNAYVAWYESGNKAYVTKLNTSGEINSTQTFAVNNLITTYDLALYADHVAYVTGATDSTNLPLVNAYQTSNHGGGDAFIVGVDFANPSGTYTRVEQTSSS